MSVKYDGMMEGRTRKKTRRSHKRWKGATSGEHHESCKRIEAIKRDRAVGGAEEKMYIYRGTRDSIYIQS